MTQHHLPCGRGFHSSYGADLDKKIKHLWYLLPVRTQFKCNDKGSAHIASTAGSNQMNPFYYLHLADMELDIRGSQIAIFCRYDDVGTTMTAVVLNFMDGRWSKSVLEPKKRLMHGYEGLTTAQRPSDPFYLHLVYFSSALRWWTNALGGIDHQLIRYVSRPKPFVQAVRQSLIHPLQELRLQSEVDSNASVPTAFGGLNRALHSIAAHLQRYGSELASMEDTLSDIIRHHHDWLEDQSSDVNKIAVRENLVCNGLDEMASQLRQVKAFLVEVKNKLENILALVLELSPMQSMV